MRNIEEMLIDAAREPIPDNGFTARVMGALPSRAAAPRPWLRPALVGGSAALGSVLAVVFAPGGLSPLQGFADLMAFRGLTPAAVMGLAMSFALLVSGIVLAVESD